MQTLDFSLPPGPRPLVFISPAVAITMPHSRAGTLCRNVTNRLLLTMILGSLIVFETLVGLLYTFLFRQQMPPLVMLSGIALLVTDMVIMVRAKSERPLTESVSEG